MISFCVVIVVRSLGGKKKVKKVKNFGFAGLCGVESTPNALIGLASLFPPVQMTQFRDRLLFILSLELVYVLMF